jgi:hypothetical protein
VGKSLAKGSRLPRAPSVLSFRPIGPQTDGFTAGERGRRGERTTILRVSAACTFSASRTRTVTRYVPTSVGVPLKLPSAGVKRMPRGRRPCASFHIRGATPPSVVSEAVYGRPRLAAGSCPVRITRRRATRSVPAQLAERASVSSALTSTWKVPAVRGTPVIEPSLEIFTPLGSCPAARLQVKWPEPPRARSLMRSETPTSDRGAAGTTIATGLRIQSVNSFCVSFPAQVAGSSRGSLISTKKRNRPLSSGVPLSVPSADRTSPSGSAPQSRWKVCRPGPQPLPSFSWKRISYGVSTVPAGHVFVCSPATFGQGSSAIPPPRAEAASAKTAPATKIGRSRLIQMPSLDGLRSLWLLCGLSLLVMGNSV